MAQLVLFSKVSSKQVGQEQPPVNNLTLNQIKASGKDPKLKVKAAEGRHLLPVVVFLLENLQPPKNAHGELRLNCARQLHLMYLELEKPWGPSVAEAVGAFGRQHCLLYSELAMEAIRNPSYGDGVWVLWRIYPKHHMFLHVVEDQIKVAGSPSECWCYADESAIGQAVLVAETCHPKTIQRLIMQKHRL